MTRGSKRNKNKNGKKRQESPPEYIPPQTHQATQTDEEPVLENETIVEETQRTLLEGQSEQRQIDVKPCGDYHDVVAFIGNWMLSFVQLFFLIMGIPVVNLYLGYKSNGSFWEYAFLLCFTFFLATGSVCLALWADFSVFLGFIFKWASFVNIFIIAILTGVVLSRSYFPIVSFNAVFWKVVPWLCNVWLISVASMGIAWFSIRDRHGLKIDLPDFQRFVERYAIVILFLLSLAIFIRNSVLGIDFNKTLWLLLQCMAFISIFFLTALKAWFSVKSANG